MSKPAEIFYVQFRSPVPMGGDFATIEYWSRDKHGKQITCEEKGNWIYLTYKGQRARVPMVNVACIREVADGQA